MTAWYNEIDPYAAQWLRNLIDAGHIAPGVVDTRSIEDVRPDELNVFTQCHFFAGIGGWSLALRLAGWPDDRPAWTGSCPCQPFSAAGKGNGFADERHLWPAWQHLIAQCQPSDVLGEQVASKAVDDWIDLVHADLEGMGYAFASIPFPASGIGAPHIRDRNYWVAHAHGSGSSPRLSTPARGYEGQSGVPYDGSGEHARTAKRSPISGLVDTESDGRERAGQLDEQAGRDGFAHVGSVVGMADTSGERRQQDAGSAPRHETAHGNPGRDGVEPSSDHIDAGHGQIHRHIVSGATNGVWAAADWLLCRDGKWRPVEPGTFPLAHGISGRVGRLRAYGNAIVPQQAAEMIRAYLDIYP